MDVLILSSLLSTISKTYFDDTEDTQRPLWGRGVGGRLSLIQSWEDVTREQEAGQPHHLHHPTRSENPRGLSQIWSLIQINPSIVIVADIWLENTITSLASRDSLNETILFIISFTIYLDRRILKMIVVEYVLSMLLLWTIIWELDICSKTQPSG